MSSITTPNQLISNICIRYIFQGVFVRKNIGDFTNLHNKKNKILKFRVNGIVSVSGTRVNVAALKNSDDRYKSVEIFLYNHILIILMAK